MKTKFTRAISNPKLVIPVAIIITLALGLLLYPSIGNAPKTDVTIENNNISQLGENSDSTISLSFPKSGRVESVTVKNGDKVTKGQILATLSAPDAKGLINQTKGALALAQAQYASLNLNYANTKKQQDIIVDNAYQTLLKTPPQAVAKDEGIDNLTTEFPLPTITGNYLLNKEGVITIKTKSSVGGLSYEATGLVTDNKIITSNSMPLGNSGLSIVFPSNIQANLTWTITLPNKLNPQYAANKNAYDLAVTNRDKILSELMQNLQGSDTNSSVAKAQVDAAEGAYESALGAYQNNVITSPINGVVSFIDSDLTVGQTVTSGKTLINIISNK
ncbi:MAG: biotin/lipoyl-binding protein [Patescibacteria group bacterium]